MDFTTTLFNVLICLVYIIPGFLLCKFKKVSADHLSTMSTILVYVCGPCMIISSFVAVDYSLSGFANMGLFALITLVLQIFFMVVVFLILRKRYNDAKYRIFTIGAVLGNVGFFGLPVVKALLPNSPEAMCYSSVYVLTMNILVFTFGVYCLTRDKKYMSIKAAILNPTTISLFVAIPLYLTGAKNYIPLMVINCVDLLGKMTTPLCMLILGIRLGVVDLKKLFVRPIIYLLCFTKMVIFPLFCYLCVRFLPLDYSFKASILILSSVPCASVILNLAEIHHAEEELAANCVLISTLLCFITIPLVSLFLYL